MLNQNISVVFEGNWAKILVDGVCQATVLATAVEKAIKKIAGGLK